MYTILLQIYLLFYLPLTHAKQNYPDCLPGTEHPQWHISDYTINTTRWWTSPYDYPGDSSTVANATSTLSFTLSSNFRNLNYTCTANGITHTPPDFDYPAWTKCEPMDGAIPHSDEAKVNIVKEKRVNVTQKLVCYERNWPKPGLVTYNIHGNSSDGTFVDVFEIIRKSDYVNEHWNQTGQPFLLRYEERTLLVPGNNATIVANKIQVTV